MKKYDEHVSFISLPLGAVFRYDNHDDSWVVLQSYGCGLVAKYVGNSFIGNRALQSICSAAESEEEAQNLMVIPVDR